MTTTPAAGWYPDPAGGEGERWWNGEQWTENTTVRAENAFILPPPPPAGSVAPARPASPAIPERGRDRGWIADAASAGTAAGSRAAALAGGPLPAGSDTDEVRGVLDQARAVVDAYGHVQTTGPQPSFGGYVAIRPSRRRPVVTGIIVALGGLVLVAAGLIAYELWAVPQLGLPSLPGVEALGLPLLHR